MITYTTFDIRRMLRATLCPATAPPLPSVRHNRRAPLGGSATRQLPFDIVLGYDEPSWLSSSAVPSVQDLPAGDHEHFPAHPEDTWPETWITVPSVCPICDGPSVADRYLNSSHGPGWRCTTDTSHYWQVRLAPLRRYLAANPPQPCYPWYDTPEAERRAWLQAHFHPPRLSAGPLAVPAPGS